MTNEEMRRDNELLSVVWVRIEMFETIKMRDVIKACGMGDMGAGKGGESKEVKVKQVMKN
jgi:hypothetical protein